MPRNLGAAVDNSFIKGLVTEATGLNFPQDACTETFNVRFNQLGSATRRLGIDFEVGYEFNTVPHNDKVISEFVWQAAAGSGTLNFTVIQIGTEIYFYQILATSGLSPGLKSFSVNLDDYKVSGAPSLDQISAQFTVGKGLLFISHPYCDPLKIEYHPDTDKISTSQIEIQIRDFEGVEDGLRDEERPSTLEDSHKYNLFNQGWYTEVKTGAEVNLEEPIAVFKTSAQVHLYPSNCDVWWLYKGTVGTFQPGQTFGQVDIGNTPAPKGHFILNAFYQDRSGATETDCSSIISGLTVKTSGFQRPTCIAFYAGRVWYAGISAQDYSSKVYYSQIVDNPKKVGYCYQAEDPTSEVDSDLLATDGGVIDIQEIGNVIKLFPVKEALVVFADNGIWAISGTTNTPFNATEFQIIRLSSVPAISSSSFVNVLGFPVWWNLDGIYSVTYNQYNFPIISSLTDTTIRTFFNSIDNDAKRYAKGAYNLLTKEIQWIFSSVAVSTLTGSAALAPASASSSVSGLYDYDTILCLNTLTSAFYPFSIKKSNTNINGIIATRGAGTTTSDDIVTDNSGAAVVDSMGSNVTVSAEVFNELSGEFIYLVSRKDNFTFAKEQDTTYTDWASTISPDDFDSYFVTGYRLRSNALSYSQIPYIVVYTKTKGGSSCFMSVVWDYAKRETANRFGRLNQVYPALPYYDIQQRRIKLRGKGRALQLRFQSETGKPFIIHGWSTFEAVNQSP